MILLFVGLGSTVFGQKDAVTKYFDKYKNDDRFTTVYVSPKMFQMIAQVAQEEYDEDIVEMVRELEGLHILTTEHNSAQFYKEAIATINTNQYEELMTVRDGGQNVKFMVKDQEGGNVVNELLLLVGGEDEFVLLSFVGKIYLDKVAKLAKNLNINGAEHLRKLDKE